MSVVEIGGGDDDENSEERPPPKTQDELYAELIVSVKLGREEAVRVLVEDDHVKPASIQVLEGGKQKWCPLVWGIFKGHDDMVTYLLEHGFGEPYHQQQLLDAAVRTDSKESDDGRSTPLHWAAYKGRLSVVCDLIQLYQFDPNERDECGNNALHLAATGMPKYESNIAKFMKVLEVLLSEQTDVWAKNWYGNTPLQLATHEGARMLLNKVMLARRSTQVDDQLEDEMAGLQLLSIQKIHEDQKHLIALTKLVDGEMLTSHLHALEIAIESGKSSYVPETDLEAATEVFTRLSAKKQVEDQMESINEMRPLSRNSEAQRLKDAVEDAIAAGVVKKQLGDAVRLIECVTGEVKLVNIVNACKTIACASPSELGQRNALAKALRVASELDPDRDLFDSATVVLSRMDAEIELHHCQSMRFKLAAEEAEGKHPTTIRILTLEPQVDRLAAAISSAEEVGVNANKELIEKSKVKLQEMRDEYEAAQVEDAERLKAEEEAAMMKGKKKKGKKKKKKK